MTAWHDYDDENHVYENEDAVAVLDGREMLGEWTLTHPTEGAALVRLWENGEDVHVWYDEDGKGFGIHPHDADSIPDGWGYIRDELLAELEAKGYAVTEARVSPSLTNRPSTGDNSGAAREAKDYERPTLAEQLRALGAEQAAQDAEAGAFHAQRRTDEAEANGEYVDYDEADAVREIEREMAIEAGDDSDIDRQVAEDDARNERAWETLRDQREALGACTRCGSLSHDASDCESEE